MKLNTLLERYKRDISANLVKLFDSDPINLKSVNRWGKDVLNRLKEFSTRGKLLRGSLILLSSEMYSGKEIPGSIETATAIELIHTSLLIHDDIMDRDELRRGMPTLHYQYKTIYPENSVDNHSYEALHFGEAMAICTGDIGFFIAFSILSNVQIEPFKINRILKLWSSEFSYVGAAQMDDMYFEVLKENISDENILNMYRYKTSRYTFSLPLVTGAELAGAPDRDIEILEELGEKIGIIFQIKDDELGLFGSKEKTGKPTGSDIQEGKNTLYISYLRRMVKGKDRRTIEGIISKKDGSKGSIEKIKEIMVDSGIKSKIDNMVNKLKIEAKKLIDRLNISSDYKQLLNSLTEYMYKRDK